MTPSEIISLKLEPALKECRLHQRRLDYASNVNSVVASIDDLAATLEQAEGFARELAARVVSD